MITKNFVSIELAVHVGNMKQNLCSDWLPSGQDEPIFARSGLPALIPHKKQISWSRNAKFVFRQCRRLSRKKRQKIYSQNKENINNSRGFIVL